MGIYMEEESFGCLFRLAGWKVLGHKNRIAPRALEYIGWIGQVMKRVPDLETLLFSWLLTIDYKHLFVA